MWITNGGLADFTVIFASFDPEQRHRGTLAVVVEKTRPASRTKKIHGKMGQRASYTAELVLENVRVPRANILGEPGDGFKIAMKTLDKTRIPGGRRARSGWRGGRFKSLAKYAAERKAFGKPINTFQAIQFKLADMKISLETARWQTLPRRLACGLRPPPRRGRGDCQVLRLGRGVCGGERGDSRPRRLRLRERVPG